MDHRRILQHVAFWCVFFTISLYNELYLSPSFAKDPGWERFAQALLAVLSLLVIKMAAVYITLYKLIPRWILAQQKTKVVLEAAALIIVATLCMRLLMHGLIIPMAGENPKFTAMQITARFFYSMLELLQIVGIATAIKLFKLRIGALENEKQLVKEKLQSEMQHLRSQINPHFLFNTLNSVFSLARTSSPETPDAVMRLSKLLRYMLYENEKKTTSIGEELKVIEDYIELQQLRFGKRIMIELSKEIDNYSAEIAPLLILPLIENAYKHGNISGTGKISLKISLQKNALTVFLKNPVSEESVRSDPNEGIGTANIQRRLELCYRDFEFKSERSGDFFLVHLKIDLASYAGFELFDSGR
jgi:LytS/YehU family sensor histidine kinase